MNYYGIAHLKILYISLIRSILLKSLAKAGAQGQIARGILRKAFLCSVWMLDPPPLLLEEQLNGAVIGAGHRIMDDNIFQPRHQRR
jgi:hypothetical protein